MARITQAQKLENQKKYDDTILNLFMVEGHQVLTYARIAHECNISITTLQGYYPSTHSVYQTLYKRVTPILMKPLDFKTKSAFYESWENALHNIQFINVIKLLFFTVSQVKEPNHFQLESEGLFRQVALESFGEDTQEVLERVIGKSMLFLSNFK